MDLGCNTLDFPIRILIKAVDDGKNAVSEQSGARIRSKEPVSWEAPRIGLNGSASDGNTEPPHSAQGCDSATRRGGHAAR